MDFDSSNRMEIFREQLMQLLPQVPQNPEDRDRWAQQVTGELLDRFSTLEVERRKLQSEVEHLRAENEQLRAQLNPDVRDALSVERELLEAIFDANPAGLALVSGDDFTILMANTAYRAATPHPEKDPIGHTLEEVWPLTEGFSGSALVQQAVQDEASVTFERVERSYPDGERRTFSLHVRPVIHAGHPAVLLALWETTQQEQALAEAEEGRRMLEALLEYIPEGITISSAPDVRVLYTSKYTAGLGDFRREELQGVPWEEYSALWNVFRADGVTPVEPQDFPAVRAAKLGEVIENEEFILRQDERELHLLTNAGPIRDAAGHIFASVVALRDISERKRSEAHQRFLSELSQALVAQNSTEAIVEMVCTQLGDYLNLDGCMISAEDPNSNARIIYPGYNRIGMNPIGTVTKDKFAPQIVERLELGQTVVISDLQLDPLTAAYYQERYAPATRALLLVPWLSGPGRLMSVLAVRQAVPRVWRPDEVQLVRGVAYLVHLALESARLFEDLHLFRQRFRVALRNAPITVFTTDRNLRITWIFNARIFPAQKLLGRLPQEIDPQGKSDPVVALARTVLESGEGVRRELSFGTENEKLYYDVTVEPLLGDQDEITGLTVAAMETTKLRRMEAEAVENMAHIEVQRRLIAERELERTRIARDLHDGPLQDLIAANFNLVEAMGINEKEERLVKMRHIQGMLQAQVRELRRFCNELRPPVLGPFGLDKTIRAHTENLRELYPDLEIKLHLQRDGKRLADELRMTLYRIYQELMHNVLRHAKASLVIVHLKLDNNCAILEVEDNGEGFDTTENWLELARKGHLGLVGVQERTQMMGGKVDIDSSPGGGTRVRVTVPR